MSGEVLVPMSCTEGCGDNVMPCEEGLGASGTSSIDICLDVYALYAGKDIVDLYCIGVSEENEEVVPSIPFIQYVHLLGLQDEVVQLCSIFDDRAMVNAID